MHSYHIIAFFLLLSHTTHSDRHICSHTAQCQETIITCSQGQPCYVECSGNWSCRRTVVECPEYEECHIKCFYDETSFDITTDYTSYLTCYNMTILASSSSLLSINASFPNISEHQYIRTSKDTDGIRWPRTMDNTTIYCPNPAESMTGGANKCQIYCDGDSLMRQMDINAVHGTSDLLIEAQSYDYYTCLRGTRLNCTHDYSLSCPLTTVAPWECQDYKNRIPDTTCEFPSMSPTLLPSISPTLGSASPTFTPTFITYNPTVDTMSPTVSPVIETTNEAAFKISDRGDGSGTSFSETGLILSVFLPCLCCAFVCLGFGVWMMKKNKENEGKRTPINGEEDDEDEEYGVAGILDYEKEDMDEEEESENTENSTIDIGVSQRMLPQDPLPDYAEISTKDNAYGSHSIVYSRTAPTDSDDESH